MTPPDKQKRVMALDVRSRRFGFAIFEGPNELLDCGVRGFRTRVVTVQVPPRQKLATLFDDFNVAVVVWRGPASRTSARKSSIGHALQRESLVRRIPVRLVTRGAVKKVFAGIITSLSHPFDIGFLRTGLFCRAMKIFSPFDLWAKPTIVCLDRTSILLNI